MSQVGERENSFLGEWLDFEKPPNPPFFWVLSSFPMRNAHPPLLRKTRPEGGELRMGKTGI